MNYDITFCSDKECKNYECERNHNNTKDIPAYREISIADFSKKCENRKKCENVKNHII